MLFGEHYENEFGQIYVKNLVTGEDAFAIFLARKFHVIKEMATPLQYLRTWVITLSQW